MKHTWIIVLVAAACAVGGYYIGFTTAPRPWQDEEALQRKRLVHIAKKVRAQKENARYLQEARKKRLKAKDQDATTQAAPTTKPAAATTKGSPATTKAAPATTTSGG